MGDSEMKFRVFLIFVFCLLCSIVQADGQYENDFSSDANCVALWRFENGALTTDSKGTNTLTSVGTPYATIITYQEGHASVQLKAAEGDYFSITNANLNAGFPGKNGDVNKKFTVTCWIALESLPGTGDPDYGYRFIANIGETGKFSWCITTNENAGSHYPSLRLGYDNGNSWEDILATGPVLQILHWYHIGITFQDLDKAYKIRVWDGSNVTETTGNSTNNINIENSSFVIGRVPEGLNGRWDGMIDELVIFNDILTSDEIDYIRQGTYPTGSPPVSGGGATVYMGNF